MGFITVIQNATARSRNVAVVTDLWRLQVKIDTPGFILCACIPQELGRSQNG